MEFTKTAIDGAMKKVYNLSKRFKTISHSMKLKSDTFAHKPRNTERIEAKTNSTVTNRAKSNKYRISNIRRTAALSWKRRLGRR